MPGPARGSIFRCVKATRFSGFDPAEPFAGWRLSPAPLLPVAAGMAVGIVLDRWVGLPTVYAVLAVVVAGGALLVVRRHWLIRPAAVAMAGVALGGVLHDNAFRRIPPDHIVRYTADEPVLATVTGTLLADPVVYQRSGGHFARWTHGRLRTRLLIDVDAIAGKDGPIGVTGLLKVYVNEPVLDLGAGERIRVVGRLYRPLGPSNPGQPDWSLVWRRQGILASMSCKLAASIARLDDGGHPADPGGRHRLRSTLRRWLYQDVTVPDETSSLLDAIVLGQRGRVSRDLNEAFIRTGTVHFLCVSGMHVGMLAIFVWWLGTSVGLGRTAGAGVVAVVVAGYVLVAEPRVPILRAGILCLLGCIAIGIRRRTSPLNWLAAGAIVILAWRPCDLFSPGFQLSFGVVLGILLLSPPIHAVLTRLRLRARRVPIELEDPRWAWPAWRRWVDRALWTLGHLTVISLAAWLVGSALTAYHFQRFSPWGWINSLLVWPLAMLIVIGGFIKVVLAAAWPHTTVVTGPLLGWGSRLLAGWVSWLDRLPWVSIDCRQPPWWWLAAYFGWLMAVAVGWRLAVRTRWLLVAGVIPLSVAIGWSLGPLERSDELTMWVLSVGPGQVTLLDMPGQDHWLCDAGTLSGFDVGEVVAVPAFRQLGVKRIRRAIVSHANFDHYCGLLAVDDHFPVEQVVTNPYFADRARPGNAVGFLLDRLDDRGIPVRTVSAGDRIDDGGQTMVEVLWPPDDLPASCPPNNRALVVRIRFGGRSILICGDIEDEPQRRLIDAGNLSSDVLVLPHHGAVVESTAEFVAAVNPQVVIRSGARGRQTTRAVIERLVAGRRYFDTARDGAIEVRIRPDGLEARAPFR